MSPEAQLAERLGETGYVELFHRLDPGAMDDAWGDFGVATFERLALDEGRPSRVRFLAAEVLFTKLADYPPEEAKTALAPVYAEALEHNHTEMPNAWGVPGQQDGAAGDHLVALSEAAVPELQPLLGDETRLEYWGSREAMSANRHAFRVKDLAAFFIARITGLALPVSLDPSERDREIETLKHALEGEEE